jgi:hypothetical protein
VAALLGLTGDRDLENLSGHPSHLREDERRGTAVVMEVRRLQHVLNKALAPIQQLLYDDVVVHAAFRAMGLE